MAAFKAHRREAHGPRAAEPPPAWRTAAIAAVRRLAASGQPFTFADVGLISGDPPNPRVMWGRLARELHDQRLIEPCGYQQSSRPGTKASAVRTWRAWRGEAA
jgi:hypothetical protein